MGRIGDIRTSPLQIIDIGTGKPLPPYEHLTYSTSAFFDSPDRMRLPTDNRLTNFKYSNKSTQDATYDMIKDALKLRNNHGDEYSLKIGKRPEGMELAQAMSMPYINLSENHTEFYIPKKYNEFSENEKRKLFKTIPDNAHIKRSIDDTLRKDITKTVSAYYVDNLNLKALNGNPMDFLEGEGKDLTEFSKNNGYEGIGSTVRPNYQEDIGQKVGNRSFDDIVKQMHSGKTVSNVNLRQLDSFKTKQLLGIYGGNVGGGNDSSISEYHRMMKRLYKKQ